MDALRSCPEGERAGYRRAAMQEQSLAWLERQGAKAGFTIRSGEVGVDGYDQHRISRKGSAPFMSYSTVDFEGILTVADPVPFLPAIARGFGAAKAIRLRPHADSAGVVAEADRIGRTGEHQEPCGSQADLQLNQVWEGARTDHSGRMRKRLLPHNCHTVLGALQIPAPGFGGGRPATSAGGRAGSRPDRRRRRCVPGVSPRARRRRPGSSSAVRRDATPACCCRRTRGRYTA